MPHPEAADTGRRNRSSLFREFVGDPMLPPRGLFDRHRDDRVLEFARNTVAEIRCPAADLAEGVFATGVVQLLEAIEAVTA